VSVRDEVTGLAAQAAGLFDLSGRTAVTVGGASGLGAAISAGLAVHGAAVAVADLDEARATEVAEAIAEATGARTTALALDVRDEASVEAGIAAAAGWGGSLDVAFNLAGINDRRPVLELEREAYERVLDVNLLGLYACCRAEGRLMTAQADGGRIVNVASIFGHVAAANQAAYASSKGGVVQLTKVLAHEWAKANVQINALCPAHIRTPLAVPVLDDEQTGAWVRSRILRGEAGEPWEIIGPALFLASRAASFVNGSSLIVDGGWIAG